MTELERIPPGDHPWRFAVGVLAAVFGIATLVCVPVVAVIGGWKTYRDDLGLAGVIATLIVMLLYLVSELLMLGWQRATWNGRLSARKKTS